MTPSPSFWLENARPWFQGAWLVLFGLALALSILALRFSWRTSLARWGRAAWVAAMLGFVALWLAGPIAEMMRRAALVSGGSLVIALGAFSVLLAGVLSLVREWFGPTGRGGLRGESVALSLLIFTLAGWWFGGASLELNPLWYFGPLESPRDGLPDGWALSLGGATLLGLSHLVRGDGARRIVNPRAAMWWIGAFWLALTLPWRGQNALAAMVFSLSAGTFACKMWRARRDGPRFLRVNVGTRAALILLICGAPVWWLRPNFQHLKFAWHTPLHDFALAGLVLAAWSLLRVRRELRAAMAPHFAPRVLLHGAAVGTLASALLMGPAAAPFFAFWPLCGLFFDLLCPREYQRESQIAFRNQRQPELRPDPELAPEVAAANARAT